KDDYLYYQNTNVEPILINEVNRETVNMIIEFMKVNGKIISHNDLNYEDSNANQIKITKWNVSIKVQDTLINQFSNKLKIYYGLNDAQREQLLSTIKQGVVTRYFGKNNIHIENNMIVQIEGLIFNEDTKQFSID